MEVMENMVSPVDIVLMLGERMKLTLTGWTAAIFRKGIQEERQERATQQTWHYRSGKESKLWRSS